MFREAFGRLRGSKEVHILLCGGARIRMLYYNTRYFVRVGRDPYIIRGTLERPSQSAAYSIRIGPDPSDVSRIVYGFEKLMFLGSLEGEPRS